MCVKHRMRRVFVFEQQNTTKPFALKFSCLIIHLKATNCRVKISIQNLMQLYTIPFTYVTLLASIWPSEVEIFCQIITLTIYVRMTNLYLFQLYYPLLVSNEQVHHQEVTSVLKRKVCNAYSLCWRHFTSPGIISKAAGWQTYKIDSKYIFTSLEIILTEHIKQ